MICACAAQSRLVVREIERPPSLGVAADCAAGARGGKQSVLWHAMEDSSSQSGWSGGYEPTQGRAEFSTGRRDMREVEVGIFVADLVHYLFIEVQHRTREPQWAF